MTRTKRAALSTAVLLSCTLAFSGCSLIGEVVPDQDGTSGEQAQGNGAEEPTSEAGTGEDSSEGSTGSADDESAEGESAGTSEEAGGAQPGGESAEVAIGESFEDPDMGDEIEIISAVRNFAAADQAELIESGGEVVLLQVKVTPGDEFGGLISMGDFEISYDDGADFWNNRTRTIEDEMEEAGFTPFDDVSRRDGGRHEGWIAFFPDEKAETYQVQYLRGAAEVIGSGEKIDEFEKTIDIPSS